MTLRRFILAVASLAAVLLPSAVASAASSDAPRVSVISDSVMTAVTWSNDPAQAVLESGLDLQIDAGVCRRLNGESCEFDGGHVPTTLTVINGWGASLGPIVVIVDGYNDIPANFAGDVELTLNTLRSYGVQHVLWTNLRESRPEFAAKNAVLRAAAQHHPELRVLDWNSYSASHLDWYQTDAIHLVPDGGVAIATFIRQAIADTLAPPAPTPPPTPPTPPATPPAPPKPAPAKLPVPAHQSVHARVGIHIERKLQSGSAAATVLRWRATDTALRRAGLHLSLNGELSGTPARAGRFAVPLEVSDSHGATAHVTVSLRVAQS